MSAESFVVESPIRVDRDGVWRVGNSQVVFDLVVSAYKQGCAPETITSMYTALDLSEVYASIAWYLRHKAEAEEYVARRRVAARELRDQILAVDDQTGFRETLQLRARDGQKHTRD